MKRTYKQMPLPYQVRLDRTQKLYLGCKRAFDTLAAALLLTAAAPVMALVALAIKLESPAEPVLFCQPRVGIGYRSFRLYKFRTMHAAAPRSCATSQLDDAHRYITPLGRILRRASLDELPQLFNVLRGEMSLVGPRPLVWTEREMRLLRRWYGVYQVRPGITGLAQVSGRDLLDNYEKLHLDREYLRRLGPAQDLHLACRTVRTVLSRAGYREGRAASPAPILEV
ncbi:MAG TPA: sugar transferase [Candidatus Anaerofilum faecale]|nr:sugar transferase [Candidatus Anaerofilum faecale]